MIVCTSVILVVISPLPFLIIFIWVLSLFLSVILAKGFSVFKNMFRKPALSFLDLSYCFLSSILFISVVIFLFFSTSLFAHLFLISLDIRLDYLFEVFLFLKVAVSLRTSLLDLFFFFWLSPKDFGKLCFYFQPHQGAYLSSLGKLTWVPDTFQPAASALDSEEVSFV